MLINSFLRINPRPAPAEGIRFATGAGPKFFPMSTRKQYLLVAAIIILAALADNWSDNPQDRPHTCTDTTHATCDGQCECDGLSCTE